MPVLRIGKKEDVADAIKNGDPEKGRMINDGYVVVKALAPMLQGRPFTDEEVNIERYFTFGVQYNLFFGAIKAGKFGPPHPRSVVPNSGCCKVCCCNCCFGCCCPYCCFPLCCNYTCCGGGKVEGLLKGMGATGGVEHVQLKTESFVAAGKKLAGFLGDRQFFGSDGKQGLVDVDLFGYIHYNVGVLKNPYAIAMVGAATCLQAWYDRMKGDAPGQADAFLNLQFMAPNA